MVRFDLGGRSPSHSPENGSFPEPFSFVGEPLASRRSAVQFWRLSIRRWIAMLPNQGLEEAVGDTPTARVPPTVARERVGEERLATCSSSARRAILLSPSAAQADSFGLGRAGQEASVGGPGFPPRWGI